MNDVVLPAYIDEIKNLIVDRKRSIYRSTIFLNLSTLCVALSAIFITLTLSSIINNGNVYSAIFTTLSLVFKDLNSRAISQDHIITLQINSLLSKIDINFQMDDTSELKSSDIENQKDK